MTALSLCIIENGLVPDDLKPQFGSYPDMIRQWLAPSLPEASFAECSPVSGEAMPAADAYDGYLLTGSRHSSYEDGDWIRDIRQFLRQAIDLKRPVFGICFGHQVMADAFGGQTSKATNGWGIGAQQYTSPFGETDDKAGCYVFHQDQVTSVPPEARVIGGSNHCPNGILEYSFPALSVQFHPEFSADYVTALAHKYSGSVLTENTSENAIASLQDIPVDNTPLAQHVADFFRQYARPST
ncbi:type 1 glutamine amidotransferase [Aidingimonas lacisalsi]|uniref:type 1 glutamine amidotransferase n=1 Tax=Aidingimonas lacisalsi TaxID=2604086 RepID=UPI0011D1A628|nr:type 1 glutamine amidotransferase [Aidingimonas lacisalsi]